MLSMTALAYEILLMRLFSIIQWHHFAYMIISLALLGYGASGALLSIFRERLLCRYVTVYLGCIGLFAFTALTSFLLSQQIQFNAEEILWAPEHALKLLLVYLLLVLPFFFAATAIGLSLMRYRNDVSRIYAADLCGAGGGALLIILLLFTLLPTETLRYIAVLGMVALAIGYWELRAEVISKWSIILPALMVLILLPLILPGTWLALRLSPYKGLTQTLRITGADVVEQRSSPLGLISVVEHSRVPFRYAPGMSLNASTEPPEQVGLFIDGDAMTVINRDDGNRNTFSYLDQLTSALPYHLTEIDSALVLGAGGGSGVLQARYHNVPQVRAVELDRNIIDLVQGPYDDFSGKLYRNAAVEVIAEEARGFVTSDDNFYSLIQLQLFDSFSASSAVLYALSESYLYTVEALGVYLAHLETNGFIGISRWIKLPPRDSLKLFATAIDALKRAGIDRPEQHLLLIRGLQTSTLLIKHNPVTAMEIERLVDFSGQRSFDLAYYPGMPLVAANQYNQLAQPYFYLGANALLGQNPGEFIKRYKFNLEPASDDRPFFFHFFKWRTLPEILSLIGKGGMPLLEWGYLILIATLLQALLSAALLILLPLFLYRRNNSGSCSRRLAGQSFVYFLCLGFAFLSIEIAYIQKFILFLHHPTFAIAVVLAAFLMFAGMGSLWSKRFAESVQSEKVVRVAVIVIVVISLLFTFFLSSLFSLLAGMPIMVRILISLALLAPLAFAMGIPFPLGLAKLAQLEPGLVPWVWGVNGCASVLSAVVATLFAIHYGFTAVIMLALILYIVSLLSMNRWELS